MKKIITKQRLLFWLAISLVSTFVFGVCYILLGYNLAGFLSNWIIPIFNSLMILIVIIFGATWAEKINFFEAVSYKDIINGVLALLFNVIIVGYIFSYLFYKLINSLPEDISDNKIFALALFFGLLWAIFVTSPKIKNI